MGNERVASFSIAFDAEDGNIDSYLASLKSKIRSAVTDISSQSAKLELFGNLTANLSKTSQELQLARDQFDLLRQSVAQVNAVGGTVGVDLARNLANASKSVDTLSTAYNKQAAQLDKLSASLKKAGVDTSNLVAEQARLAAELKAATDAAALQGSKDLLGFKSLGDVQPQIDKLTAAFETLRASGKLSADEIAAAETQLAAKIAAVRNEVTDLGTALTVQGSKDLLGFQTIDDIKPKIEALTQAFEQLRASGTLSADQISAAEQRLIVEVKALQDQVKALNVTTAQAAEQNAKDLLGFKTLADVQPRIDELRAAFDTLKNSGKLSATEIAAAEKQLVAQTAAVKAEVTDLRAGFVATATDAKLSFTSLSASVLGILATVSTVVNKIKEATDANREYQQSLINIGTITNLSTSELAALGEEARGLARTLGFDVVEGLKEVFNIISTGIPADNAIAVLAATSEAAKISQASLADTTKLATTLINQFGVGVGDVTRVLDIFIQGAHNGGPTITALAGSIGSLAPIALATGTPITDLAAALQVMVKAGVPAEAAVGDLQKVLQKLDTSAAQAQLKTLGITTGDFISTLQQLGSRNISLTQLTDLGLVSTKSATGVLALTQNTKALTDALAAQPGAVAAATKALASLEQTPHERLELFDAAVKDLNINIGQSIGTSSKYAVVLANIINGFNTLDPKLRQAVLDTGDFNQIIGTVGATALVNFVTGLTNSAKQVEALSGGLTRVAGALGQTVGGIKSQVDTQLTAVDKRIGDSVAKVQALIDELGKITSAASQAGAAQIQELNARASSEQAALDQSLSATEQTAAAILAIQTKLAADRQAIIDANAATVIKASETEAAAILKVAQQSGKDQGVAAQQATQVRIAALQPILAAYQNNYNQLVAMTQGYIATLKGLENERVTFNESVEDKLLAIRNQGLSGFDQFYAKVTQIDTAIANAQQAFATGEVANGKRYTDQAIALSEQLKGGIVENGTVVVSQFEAQNTALTKIKTAADQYNAALDKQSEAAKNAANSLVGPLEIAKAKFEDIAATVDQLSKDLANNLNAKITVDDKDLSTELAKIDTLLEQKDHVLQVQLDAEALKAQVAAVVAAIKAGATDGVNLQLDIIHANLAKIAAEAPELKIDTKAADAQIEAIRLGVEQLSKLNPKFTVDSNVSDVQKQIDALKAPTESTHTVHVVVDNPGNVPVENIPIPGLARGGFAGKPPAPPLWRGYQAARQAVQGYASGGMVFPALPFAKVPGAGNRDTVPARLQSGAFVVRKAASQYYGDALMSRLAVNAARVRYLAGGGFGNNDRGLGSSDNRGAPSPIQGSPGSTHAPGEAGYISTDDQESLTGEISAPTLPSDDIKKRKVILDYVFNVAQAAGADDYFYWRSAVRLMNTYLNTYNSRPSDANLETLLQQARAIGLNLGVKKGTHTGFDVDGRSWHRSLNTNIPAGLSGPLSYVYDFYAKGGATRGTDTVNAMLTPGEYVVNAARTAQLGAPFMHAVNDLRIDRDTLAGMLQVSAPPRPTRYYAAGGEVPGGATIAPPVQANGGKAGDVYHFNITADPRTILTPENIKRLIVPVIRESQRKDTPKG